MDNGKGASMAAGVGAMVKKAVLFLLKAIYIIPFFVIGLWLISVVYFPGFDLNASISLLKYGEKRDSGAATTVRKKGAVPFDHFHITDKYIERLDNTRQVCDQCHGAYAHGKEKEVRALLNMHTGFMSCTVCHVRKDGSEGQGGETLSAEIDGFSWVDNDTGEFKASVAGEYGKYAEMIHPVMTAGQSGKMVYDPIAESAAQRFLESRPEWSEKQLDEARLNLHRKISKEAITCTDCHQKDGYVNFASLGYSKQRVDYLISNEVVGMIENYKTFYLPSVIDFRGE